MPLDPLTIISAFVAIFVIWKLRSVLGARTGLEKPPTNPFMGRQSRDAPPQGGASSSTSAAPNVIRLPGATQTAAPDSARWRPYAESNTPAAAGLDAIAAADPAFSVRAFIDGARIAYETAITGFAAGDDKTLRSLLADDVHASFAAAIAERGRRGETLTTTFVSLDESRIVAASQQARTARIEVHFTSKQVTATRDRDGTLTDGSPDRIVDMDDAWTFARDVTSRDPNWKIVATRSAH